MATLEGFTGREFEAHAQALSELDKVLSGVVARVATIRERIALVLETHATGESLRDGVPTDGLIVRQLAALGTELAHAGARVRRTQARALAAEGLTVHEIAEAFGVSRQRVAKILQQEAEDHRLDV